MKRFRLSSLLVLIFLAIFALSSCHDDIYGRIKSEVKLESSGLQGDINQIVHYKDYLVTCNGYVYYKTNKPSTVTGRQNHQWDKTTSPSTDKGDNDVPATTYFLASDNTYLYALTYMWKENKKGENTPDTATIYYTDSDPGEGRLEWKEVTLPNGVSNSYENAKIIFDNKAISIDTDDETVTADSSNRKAYARIRVNGEYKVYELNGSSEPSAITISSSCLLGGLSESNESNVITACYFNGETYFSRYYAIAANDKCLYYSRSYTNSKDHVDRDNTRLYYIDSDGSNKEDPSYSPSEGGILSIAAASDALLLGTTSGLARVSINSSGVPTGTPKFGNNGDSVISEYVFMVFILNPEKKQNSNVDEGTDEYAASTIYGSIRSSSDSWDDTGLYAYYPSRREWNRDGT